MMCEVEKKKIIQSLTGFYRTFPKEVMDMFPEDTSKISPLLFRALCEIYYTEDITSSVLTRRLSITVPNTSRCLQKLNDMGYVIKVKDIKDRRITHIKLTEKGLKLIEDSIVSMDEMMTQRLSVLEIDELVRLSDAFFTIKELFRKIETSGI
jgi:DNA-binding MarR family transcriptional regulator